MIQAKDQEADSSISDRFDQALTNIILVTVLSVTVYRVQTPLRDATGLIR